MKPSDAERLVLELCRDYHIVFNVPDKTRAQMREYLEMQEPAGAVTKLPGKDFYVPEYPENKFPVSERYLYIRFRRLIDNQRVEQRPRTICQKASDLIAEMGVTYSSDLILKKALERKEFIDVMRSSDSPYSLLVKMTEIDTTTGDDVITTTPLIIVPGDRDDIRYRRGVLDINASIRS